MGLSRKLAEVVGSGGGMLYDQFLKWAGLRKIPHITVFDVKGSKRFYSESSTVLKGTKYIQNVYNISTKGVKRISCVESLAILGSKRLHRLNEYKLLGSKKIEESRTIGIKGKRDITAILEALDLV